MKKLLLIPDYLEKSFEKNINQVKKRNYKINYSLKQGSIKKIFKGKTINYKVCFYPENSAVRKVWDSGEVYNLEKIVAVGSNEEYNDCKRVLGMCSFEKEIITLKVGEIVFKRFEKKTIEKILKLLN